MTHYERFEKSAQQIAPKDFARWLYIASACRLWLREQGAARAASRRKNTARRNRQTVSQWDWTSTGAPVMR